MPEWICRDDAILPMPNFLPLSIITRKTVRGATPSIVIERLRNCFVSRSIVIELIFNDHASVLLSFISNTSYVKMFLHLYLETSRETAGDQGGIIVETKKHSGNAVLFARESKAILRAANGTIKDPIKNHRPPLKPVFLRKRKSEECFLMIENINEIISDGLDSMLIGWTSLCALTDTSISNQIDSEFASKVVLGVDNDETGTDINSNLVDILSNDKSELDHELFKRIQTLSFSVLHNALSTLMSKEVLDEAIQRNVFLRADLVEILIDEITEAEVKLHEAYLAAASLAIIVQASKEGRKHAVCCGVFEILITAQYVGERNHAKLAAACRNALIALTFHDEQVLENI